MNLRKRFSMQKNANAVTALSDTELTTIIREGRLIGALVTLLGVYKTTDGIKDDEYYYYDVPALETTVVAVFNRILEIPDYSSALKEYFGKEPIIRHQEWLTDDDIFGRIFGRNELHMDFIKFYRLRSIGAPETHEDRILQAIFGDPQLYQLHTTTERLLAAWTQESLYPVLLLETTELGHVQGPELDDLLFGAIELLSLYSEDFEKWLHQKLLD